MQTLLLTRRNLEKLADMALIVDAVDDAFRQHADGHAQMPPKVYISLGAQIGDFRAMPSAIQGAAGIKWVNSHPNNPRLHGLPAVMGVYVLSDPANAFPLAILDGTLLTALRTGAAGGVASKYLAKDNPKTVGFIGTGVQARFLLAAHRAVYPEGFSVLCADQQEAAAETFRSEVTAAGLEARVVSPKEAALADVLCTSTPGTSVSVQEDWIRPDAHVNAMGADAPGKQELATGALKKAQIVIDEHHQASHSGEINRPYTEGLITDADLAGTLGEIMTGRKVIDRNRLTIFDSTGLAIQDVAVAKLFFERARDAGIGTPIDLVGLQPD